MNATMMRLWKDDEGANAVEYGLIAAVIAVALIAAFSIFKNSLYNLFTDQADKIDSHP
jgi:pilus assembly protein Flp/PilA